MRAVCRSACRRIFVPARREAAVRCSGDALLFRREEECAAECTEALGRALSIARRLRMQRSCLLVGGALLFGAACTTNGSISSSEPTAPLATASPNDPFL